MRDNYRVTISILAMPFGASDVRFGSIADMCTARRHVRFTPDSGHQATRPRCSLCAKTELITAQTAPSCVDGPRLARDFLTRRTEIACSHVSGLLMQSEPTAGPDGVREPRSSSFERGRCPGEAPGFSRLRRIDRLCHHASLLSRKLQYTARQFKLPRPCAGNSPAGASPPRRCVPSCSPALPLRPYSAVAAAGRSPTDRHWSPSSVADWRWRR